MTTAPPEPDRRGYRTALAVLAVGAGLLFLGYAQTWSTSVVTQDGLPTIVVSLSGRDVQPGGAAAAVLALAGLAGLVATRRTGRVASGVLLVVSGLAAGVAAASFGAGARGAVDTLVSERAGVDVVAVTSTTAWWTAAVAGGLLVAAAGAAAAARGGRWPVLGARYGRTGSEPSSSPRPTSEGVWERLDRGEDPTLGPEEAPRGAGTTGTSDAASGAGPATPGTGNGTVAGT